MDKAIQTGNKIKVTSGKMLVNGRSEKAISFSYSLTEDSKTSAGVYDSDGVLVKTLWNNVRKTAGTHESAWDGTNDEGFVAANGTYEIKVLSNNVEYLWEGVIGNTSDSFTGDTKHFGYRTIKALTVVGDYAYFTKGYGEGSGAQGKFLLTNPNTVLPTFNLEGTNLDVNYIDSDANGIVYYAGRDPFSINHTMVYAVNAVDDTEHIFPNGISYDGYYGGVYNSVVGYLNHTDQTGYIYGLAVQPSGDFIFITRTFLNSLYVISKSTGDLLQTITMESPTKVGCDSTGNLWITHKPAGVTTLEKFSVAVDGLITSLGVTAPGVDDPMAMDVSPDDNFLMIADGGTSQQIKKFNNSTGAFVESHGHEGGYLTNAVVSNDRYWFRKNEDGIPFDYASIAYEPSGNFWVADISNYRVIRFTNTYTYIDHVQARQGFYSCLVNQTNSKRVFAEFMEYEVDDTQPLTPGKGNWIQLYNWGGMIPATYKTDHHNTLFGIATLSNGKTYAQVKKSTSPDGYEIIELIPDGTIRFTGVIFDSFYWHMYGDGSLRKQGRYAETGNAEWYYRSFTGFDVDDNPTWGAVETYASVPSIKSTDPSYTGNTFVYSAGEYTSSDIAITFEGNKTTNQKWHLGAVRKGDNKYLWKAAKGTKETHFGPYPEDGYFDNGNGTNYPGGKARAIGRNIIWNHHGEFYRGAQTNMWHHLWDNGLVLGVYGVVRYFTPGKAPFGMAGNTFHNNPVWSPNGDILVYYNDEGTHAGIHRMRISNLNSINEQTAKVITLNKETKGLSCYYIDSIDLNNTYLKEIRVNGYINFNWGNNIPINSSLSSTNFSIRWDGFIVSNYTEEHTFYLNTNSKARLWINNTLVIDQWVNNVQGEYTGLFTFTAGKKYEIRVEYSSTTDNNISLSWSSLNTPKEIIGSESLYPATKYFDGEGINLLDGIRSEQDVESLYGWVHDTLPVDTTWVTTTSKRYHLNYPSPDLYIYFGKAAITDGVAVTNTFSRDLGDVNTTNWKIRGDVNYEGHSGNQGTGGGFMDILDVTGKIITRLEVDINYSGDRIMDVIINGTIVASGPEGIFKKGALHQYSSFVFECVSGSMYASFDDNAPITITPVDATADVSKPKHFRFYFFTTATTGPGRSGRAVDVKNLWFNKN